MGSRQQRIRVQSLKNQRVIAETGNVAVRFWDRFIGWMGRSRVSPGEALYFPRCQSVHTWFMSFPIDVVFLKTTKSEAGKVHHVVHSVFENVRPWRLLPPTDWKADDVLELPLGSIEVHGLEVGDEVCIS